MLDLSLKYQVTDSGTVFAKKFGVKEQTAEEEIDSQSVDEGLKQSATQIDVKAT